MRNARTLVMIVALSLGLGGCTQEQAPSLTDLIGQTFAEVEQTLPENGTYLIQDASPLVDREPSYTIDQFGSSTWTVVGICADSADILAATTIEIAVTPTADTPELDALDLSTVVSCDGLDYRG